MPLYRTRVLYCLGASSGYLPVGSTISLTEAEAALYLAQGTLERLPEAELTAAPVKSALVELPAKPEAKRG